MNKYTKMFFEAADDLGGGEDGITATDLLDEPKSQTPEPKEPVAPAPKTGPSVDAAELAKQFASQLGQHFKPVNPDNSQPKLSPEEAKKLLNVWEPTPEWLAKYDNLDTRMAAIAEMRDGQIRQADTIAQIRLHQLEEKLVKQLEEKYGPVMKNYESEQVKARENRFNSRYPELAKPELAPLLGSIISNFQTQGKTFSSEEELFDELAKGVEAVIKVNNPEFKLTAQAVSTKSKSNSIPVTTSGTGGSAGGTSGVKLAPKGPKALQYL